jgi:histidyl-tRNA synthetase
MWQRMGLDRLQLEINSLGTPDTRIDYRGALVAYFSGVKNKLDEDSIRRLDKNPLRILDSKNPEMQAIVEGAPVMLDYLDDESAAHFGALKAMLDSAGVAHTVNPRLVRGLDYYNRTVFEWATDALGSQGAVCSGGRYDGLAEKIGGKRTPGIGWAMGVERLVMLYEACGGNTPANAPDVYIVAVGEAALERCLGLAEQIRDGIGGVKVELNLDGGSFKSQLKRADKSGAEYALIMGDDEIANEEIGMKPLRSKEDQISVALEELVAMLKGKLEKKAE